MTSVRSIPTDLTPQRISPRTARYGRSLDVVAVTESTNDDARRAAARGAPDGHVIVADRQTSGRGANGRRWDSPGGTDLYFSIVARLPLEAAQLPPLTLAVGLGVARAIDALAPGATVELKWPNDVLLDGRKVSGVLVEALSTGTRVESAVLGIGVDVNRRRFAPELESIATSLCQVKGEPLDRADVLVKVLAHVEEQVDGFVERGPRAVVAGVDARLAWRGCLVTCGGISGQLIGLREDGALRIRNTSGERAVISGQLRRGD